ncbi:trehalose-6-phosphate synthase [Terricaulis sp.]|uniref:trehalose-6-phosphate synthase n=1 Tax=Terricaulis sp. TaxID=2768686 RepID=UPI003784738F
MTWLADLRRRFGGIIKYAALGLLLLVALTLVVAPFSRSLVDQWSRRDVESRSRLVFNSIQGPILRAIANGDQARLNGILADVTQDERVLALGLCDRNGDLRGATPLMPRAFSCENVARSEEESFSSISNNGRRVMVGAFPIDTNAGRTYLVVLHDLSYADARSGQAQTFAIATLIGVAIIIISIMTILAALVWRGWMAALRQGIEDLRSGRPPRTAQRDRSIMDAQIQKALKDLEVGRTPTDTAGIDWTPNALHQLLADALPGAEVIIVSNREPYIHNTTDQGIVVQTPASGLVSALEPVMRATGGTWIAHGSGSADRETVDSRDRIDVPPGAPAYKLRRVWVSEEEQDGYYYGLANEGLWPLCHIAFVRPTFRESDWRYYQEINERFAEAVAEEAQTEDPIVLVQDYHFALAPKMIRARLPKATIITFWHIPWPNAETFGICPWKESILEGLLGSSILGFHTQFHCNNFFETVDRFIESRIDREHSTVSLAGHETRIRPYPISIEWPPKALQHQASIETCRLRVRERLGLAPDAKLAVGIERFDYTKGILDRMQSIDILLEKEPAWRRQFTFVQVAAPSRSKLAAYANLQHEAVQLADEINARHGDDTYQPIRLLIRHHEPDEVFELFRAADICIVSSLHDGMNLVAKEFVASRDDDRGVLVLSSFTGASREMSEALIVNPYDGQEMARALDTALRMPEQEQRERMRLMRQQVREQNVYRWAGRMLVDAARIRQRERILDLAARP